MMQVHKGQTHTVGVRSMQQVCSTQQVLVQKGQTPRSAQQMLVQKGQLVQWTQQIWVVGTVTFSAKRSNPPHRVGTQYAVGTQCAVGVSAKRSTGTVDLANMGGGNHYLQCKKVKHHAVGAQYTVGTVCSMQQVRSMHLQCKKVKPTQWGMQQVCSRYTVHSMQQVLVQKGQNHTVGYAVGMQLVCSTQWVPLVQ